MNEFYKTCAVPKPQTKKKKKLTNGWKDKPYRRCAICGAYGAERHELFGGANRQTSIKMKFQVDLCREHHEAFHRQDAEWAPVVTEYRARAQRKWELDMVSAGISPQDTRKLWVEMIGRNYLIEEEENEQD